MLRITIHFHAQTILSKATKFGNIWQDDPLLAGNECQ